MINKFINLIFFSFILLTTTQVNSQDNTFFRKYNLGGMQGGLQLAVTSDGGFIATGQHEGNGGNGDCDIYVYRVDLCGNIVWFKLYGTGSQEGGKSIKQTSDGGFIVSGLGPLNTSPRAFNMKLDPNGNIEWGKRYPGEWLLYSEEALNGNFLNLSTGVLMRTDSIGNVLWRKNIGFMGSMSLWLDELSNGDIIVTSTGNGSDIYVGRFTSLGNTVWIKKYGTGYSSVDHVEWSSKGVVNSIENSVCVTSPTYLGSQGGENILVMKLNLTDGSLIWSKSVGGPASDQSRDIQLFPGGYAIAGNTASYPVAINPSAGIIQNFSERDALLFTMDENGNEIWSRTYGGDERDKAIGVQYNSDNGFTLSAYSSSSIFGNFDSSMDPLFIKTDSLGFVACQTNSPPLVFQDVLVSITPILTQPSNEGINSYSFTPNVIDFNPSDGYLCQQCISTPLFQVSDTAVCVGDTVSFFNTTIIGLTCFQQWYIDGQQYDGTINPFYSFDTAGDYQIQLMSTCGVNADTFNIVIHVYPIPTVDAGIDTNFCVNGILTLSGEGADTYIWSNGVINNVPFFPSSSGTYSVIGTTIYGCTNYDTLEIIINMRPEVLAQDTILCSDIACGVTLANDIDGPTASTYNIISINSNGLSSSAGNPLVANGVINSNLIDDAWTNTTNAPVDVIYTIVPISAIGCEGTPFTVTITVNPEPVVLDQATTICSDVACGLTLANDIDGPTVSFYEITSIDSVGLSPFPLNSTIGNGFPSNEIIDDGYTNLSNASIDVDYKLIPTGVNGCIGDPFSVILTVNPEPIVIDQTTTICSDVACGLTLGDDIDGPTASTYNIITINSNGLSSSAGLPLVANGVLNSNLLDDTWTNTTTAPVDVIYTIVPISAAACEGTPFTVTLTINPEPVVSNQVLTVCSDLACGLTLADDIDGPTASTYNIITINSNGLSSSAGLPLVANGVLNSNLLDDTWTNTTTAPVDVIYTIVPISAAACEGTPFTVTLTINPEPVVSNQVLTVCSDLACGLTLADDIDGPTASTYNIITINSNGISSSAGLPLVANGVLNSNLIDDSWTNTTNAPVDVIYTIVPISAATCEGTPFTVTLTINPEPMVPNQVAAVCSEELIGVTLANDPNGPNLQSWNITNISIGSSLVPNSANVNLGTTISNQYVAGDIYVNNSILDIDVIYSLIPNAINACIGNPFTITITVFPLPVFNVFDAVVCADHYVTLTGNPSSYSYNWDHGVSNNVPFIPPYTDTYNVVATNTITGCIQYSSALVTVHPNPIADFIQSWDELMAIFTNTSSGAVNYYWNMGDGGIIITSKNVSYTYQVIDSVSYIVTLIAETEFGCLDTISRVITTPLVFYVPNSFTPDGNENNNEFTPVFSSKRKVENYSLSIYDRWGEIVFETKDIDFGWDGTYKNNTAQIGTYTWQLQFTNSFNSKKELINGHVNLLR